MGTDVVPGLLEAGADANAREGNITPLALAVAQGVDVVPVLLKAGADVNQALLCTASTGEIGVVRALLQVDAGSKKTADLAALLSVAVAMGNASMVAALHREQRRRVGQQLEVANQTSK